MNSPAKPGTKKLQEGGQLYWIFLTTGKSSEGVDKELIEEMQACLLYTSPSPRDQRGSRMPSSA